MILNDHIDTHPSPGLLSRAKALRTPQPTPPEKDNDQQRLHIEEFEDPKTLSFITQSIFPQEEITVFRREFFQSAVKLLPDGLELPSDIFREICKHLQIESGALLLLDREQDFFASWVSIGLDKTSQHRLRLTKDFIDELTGGFPNALLLESKALEPLQPFLSMRLFDMTEAAALAPIFVENHLFGILFITECAFFSDSSFLQHLSAVSQITGDVFTHSRFHSLTTLSHEVPSLVSDQQQIFSRIDSCIEEALTKKERITLILLDLNPIIEFLGEQQQGLDPFRFKKDILTLLNSMVEGIGEVLDLEKGKALLVLNSKTLLKDSMLLNQIQISIKSFFRHQDYFPQIRAIVKRIPDDGMEASVLKEYL